MPSTKQHRWAVPNAAKKEQSKLRKLAKAEAQRLSMIRFHALRLIHYAKPAFGPQTNPPPCTCGSEDLGVRRTGSRSPYLGSFAIWFGVGLGRGAVFKLPPIRRSHGRADIDLCRQCGCVRKLQGGILTTAIAVLLRSPRARLCISTSAGRGSEGS